MARKIGVFISNDELSEYVYEKLSVDTKVFPFSFSPVGFTDSKVFSPGDIIGLMNYLKEKDVSELVFIGRIAAWFVFSRDIHPSGKKFLESAESMQGERILADLSSFLAKENIRVLPLTEVLADELSEEKVYTSRQPEKNEQNDIEMGVALLKDIIHYRVGQSVAVKNGAIIAVEGMEGTDAMIERAGLYSRDFVVVKMAGADKDERFDLPVVGPETIRTLKTAGGRVIAVEAGKTIIFNKEPTISICNRYSITLLGVNMNKAGS